MLIHQSIIKVNYNFKYIIIKYTFNYFTIYFIVIILYN